MTTSSLSTVITSDKNDGSATLKSVIAKRHLETIDDVVSSVMEKIRNNLPLEGEFSLLNTASISTQNSTASTSRLQHALTSGSNAKGRGAKLKNVFVKNVNEENRIIHPQQIISNSSHLISGSNATALLDSGTGAFLTTIPAGQEHLALSTLGANHIAASTTSTGVSLQQPLASDQVTILSNFTEIIRASTSSQQATTSQVFIFLVKKIVFSKYLISGYCY